jgi:putative transcriptional regulator
VTPRRGGSVRAAPAQLAAGATVRRRRRDAALSQQQLADAVGVSRQTVVALEGGDYSPSVYLALRVAKELGTTVEALWGEPEP